MVNDGRHDFKKHNLLSRLTVTKVYLEWWQPRHNAHCKQLVLGLVVVQCAQSPDRRAARKVYWGRYEAVSRSLNIVMYITGRLGFGDYSTFRCNSHCKLLVFVLLVLFWLLLLVLFSLFSSDFFLTTRSWKNMLPVARGFTRRYTRLRSSALL